MAGGIFISFEGIDGSGKSTQSRALASRLGALGRDVVMTREPGGSDGAEEIRKLLVEGHTDKWSPETEILLFTAARRDHLERVIAPALKAGKIVITDRFADSTRVYQGQVRADLVDVVDDLHEKMIGREPDITFLVDIDPEVSLARGLARNSGEDRFEDFGLAFQKDLRASFLKLAQKSNGRIKIINGANDMDAVEAEIFTHIEGLLA